MVRVFEYDASYVLFLCIACGVSVHLCMLLLMCGDALFFKK